MPVEQELDCPPERFFQREGDPVTHLNALVSRHPFGEQGLGYSHLSHCIANTCYYQNRRLLCSRKGNSPEHAPSYTTVIWSPSKRRQCRVQTRLLPCLYIFVSVWLLIAFRIPPLVYKMNSPTTTNFTDLFGQQSQPASRSSIAHSSIVPHIRPI
ncbi:hypothetical protein BDN67DRAFT_998996 [Paxillus ammoniavirescens]|nr:hypothetical protein BDN67DRAFT_998996 [Paxillus ammoniavirescens]